MNKKQLREGNDALRRSLCPAATGRPNDAVFLTRGVTASPCLDEVLARTMAFDAFTNDNDPWEEHDLGMFSVRGEEYMFKFDYFDEKLEYGADPLTQPFRRVLTILRADEY